MAAGEPLSSQCQRMSGHHDNREQLRTTKAGNIQKLKDDFLISNFPGVQKNLKILFALRVRLRTISPARRSAAVHVGESSGVMFALFSFLIGLKSSLLVRSGALLQFAEKSKMFFNLVEVLVGPA